MLNRLRHQLLTFIMPFHFNAEGVSISGGMFNDVGGDMHISSSDAYDVKVNSDNTFSKTYGDISVGAGGGGGDGIGTNGGTGIGGNGGAGGSLNFNEAGESSGIMNVLPGIENASKVAKNAAATRVFKNIRTGMGGNGGQGVSEGGKGGSGGSAKITLSPNANYEFGDVETGRGGEGGRGKVKGGHGGVGGDFLVEEETTYSWCCIA